VRPTRRQIERYAKATHATADHLLLAKPPVDAGKVIIRVEGVRTFDFSKARSD
jgi:hypothetical protein